MVVVNQSREKEPRTSRAFELGNGKREKNIGKEKKKEKKKKGEKEWTWMNSNIPTPPEVVVATIKVIITLFPTYKR